MITRIVYLYRVFVHTMVESYHLVIWKKPTVLHFSMEAKYWALANTQLKFLGPPCYSINYTFLSLYPLYFMTMLAKFYLLSILRFILKETYCFVLSLYLRKNGGDPSSSIYYFWRSKHRSPHKSSHHHHSTFQDFTTQAPSYNSNLSLRWAIRHIQERS